MFRGVEGRRNWKPGREQLQSPTSTSGDIVTAKAFSGNDTILEIHPASGVRALVYNVPEVEVLFAPGQTLEILQVHDNVAIGSLNPVRKYVVARIRP